MPIKLANNASGTLATAISASDTGIALTTGDGAEFPTLSAGDYFYATITSTQGTQEIVKATARSGDSLTVVRAQEGTTAAGFAAGARFELRVTAQSVFDAVGDVVASQVSFTPTGGISATDVQAALAEVDTEKVAFTRLDDNDGSSLVGFLQAGTNAVPRTVQSKLRETVSVLDFGAVGDGVTDDTAAIQAAANTVKGTSTTLHIPAGDYLVSSLIDFTQVKNIASEGVILSSVTSGAAVRIGTEGSANVDMDGGSITLTVSGIGFNGTKSGSVGIQVRGSARCNYRLYSYNWDIGVELAPQFTTGIQYVAFNRFQIYTNGCRTGLKFNGNYSGVTDRGWINENTFLSVSCYPQNNQLGTPTYGVHMTGSYASNNNVFYSANFEGQTVPIWIETGIRNSFYSTRLEAAGNVRFGNSTTAGDQPGCAENYIQSFYGNNKYGIGVDWQATRPNLVSAYDLSPSWMPVFSANFDDFIQVGSTVYSTKFINSVSGTGYFEFGVLDAVNRTFDPGSNHSAYTFIKVQKGDILRIYQSSTSADYMRISLTAQDASKVNLPNISASETPYIGTNGTPASTGASGTSATLDVDNTLWEKPILVSINRSEVQWLRIRLFAGVNNTMLFVERVINSQNLEDGRVENLNPVKAVTNFTTAPQYAGQIGIASTTRVAVGSSPTGWVQVGQVPVSATAAQIASAADAINTTNKVIGLVVRDTTNNRLMFATGSSAISPWYVADGSASVTPA